MVASMEYLMGDLMVVDSGVVMAAQLVTHLVVLMVV